MIRHDYLRNLLNRATLLADAADMLQGFGSHMRACDSMIVAMDGRNRDPELIRRAYNDKTGISRQFALNTLHHLNHLFGKDVVDVGAFYYAPIYNEVSRGFCTSAVRSIEAENRYRMLVVMKHISCVKKQRLLCSRTTMSQ